MQEDVAGREGEGGQGQDQGDLPVAASQVEKLVMDVVAVGVEDGFALAGADAHHSSGVEEGYEQHRPGYDEGGISSAEAAGSAWPAGCCML